MPRKTAIAALERFRRDGAWSGQVLSALIVRNGLDRRDAAFASRLFYTALQNLYLIDFYIDSYTNNKIEPKVRDILRIGVVQLLFLDRVPASAAVSESVKLSRTLGYARAAGFVNAVLRKIDRNRDHLPVIPDEDPVKMLSIRYSHPADLVAELIGLRGTEGAEAVLKADNEPAPLYIHANTLRIEEEALQYELDAEPFRNVSGCFMLDHTGSLTEIPAFTRGEFYVQDPAAHEAVVRAELQPGMRVLDCCAAPGGKSFAAAVAMQNTGIVDSRDINDSKLNLVMDGADRMGLSCISCRQGDAGEIFGGDYDVVFADLPCSGYGVIRKKPDIRYKPLSDARHIPELQMQLLNAASTAVKPGGRLLYSTCTWLREENEGVSHAFLAGHPDFTKTYERTFWPDTDGTDGFYICRMDRKKPT